MTSGLVAAVERLFSKLKEFIKLDNLHIQGLPKVDLHCRLAVLVIQAQLCARFTGADQRDH